MGQDTAIEWCDHTFNPWWGCERVSAACRFCYAETFAKRFNVEWGKSADRRFFGDKHWAEPLRWGRAAAKAGVRKRVFCASMADVFEDRPDLIEHRARLWALVAATPHLDWLLLTKRPENIAAMVPWQWSLAEHSTWPINVWVGTTVEDQAAADLRIPYLLAAPAPVRFLSCEPMMERVWLRLGAGMRHEGVSWVICGGESGRSARPMQAEWARDLRDQCIGAGVPFLFKQWGEHDAHGMKVGKKAAGRVIDGRTWDEFPEVVPV